VEVAAGRISGSLTNSIVRIEAQSITKRFGSFTALSNVSLAVESGELVALLGPSGSGKTSLLRVIAGLDVANAGRVLFDGRDATHGSLRERGVGFVFQHYALFRHMSVFENVAFGLRVRPRRQRPCEQEVRQRVGRLLELVQLDVLGDRMPSQLSGGQRQRVALARVLAVEPEVLLLDEPFGSLDAKVRKELRRWLRRLHDELHVTSIFVTHDQEEALELADRVVIMNQGTIEQVGTPSEVYDRPATPFVFQFLGDVNLFHGRVEGHTLRIDGTTVGVPVGSRAEGDAQIYVRPHRLTLRASPTAQGEFPATVERVNVAGPLVRIDLVAAWGAPLRVEMSEEQYRAMHAGLRRGSQVHVGMQQDFYVEANGHGYAQNGDSDHTVPSPP
jgi:sulfate transport system ATP-binding protein